MSGRAPITTWSRLRFTISRLASLQALPDIAKHFQTPALSSERSTLFEPAALRYERHADGATDRRFFGDRRSFTKNYLKKIRRKVL